MKGENTEKVEKQSNDEGSSTIPFDDEVYSKSHNATFNLIKTLDSIIDGSINGDEDKGERIELLLAKTIPTHLLTLKQSQRTLCLKYNRTLQSKIQQKRKDVESQSLLLQNLIYEKCHLEREIQECEQGFENVHFYNVAREELYGLSVSGSGENNKHEDGNTGDKRTNEEGDREEGKESMKSRDATINAFLQQKMSGTTSVSTAATASPQKLSTFNYRDPSKHAYIQMKLQQHLKVRGNLHKELTDVSKRKLALMSTLKDQNKFLNGVPDQISKLEEWSLPIQDYFQKEHQRRHREAPQYQGDGRKKRKIDGDITPITSGGNGVELLIGSERRKRLQCAKGLSGPLYTLFIQFQSFLDAYCTATKKQIANKISSDKDDSCSQDEEGHPSQIADNYYLNDIHNWKLDVLDIVSEGQESAKNNTEANDDEEGYIDEGKNDAEDLDTINITKGENKSDIAHESAESNIDDIVKEYTKRESKAVQLCIPIPNLKNAAFASTKSTRNSNGTSKAKKDYVKIQFEYIPKLQITTVHVVGEDGNGNKSEVQSLKQLLWSHSSVKHGEGSSVRSNPKLLLLHNLFNDDNGIDLPHGVGAGISFGIDDGVDDKKNKDDAINEEDNFEKNQEEMFEDDESIHDSHLVREVTKEEIIMEKLRSEITYPSNLHRPKPFHWCQNLAGLYFPTNTGGNDIKAKYCIDPTTKSTVIRLSRRVRSHATLSAMIKALMTKSIANPIPVHPSMENQIGVEDAKTSIQTKLKQWEEDTIICDNGGGECKFYNALIVRKAKSLKVRVKIDPRYPAVPPVWSLQRMPVSTSLEKESDQWHQRYGSINILQCSKDAAEDQQAPLYDSTLGQLEVEVNTLKGVSRFYNDEVEESYDWILIHQLRVVLAGWDEYQQSLEKDGAGDDTMLHTVRQRRGRDRFPIKALNYDMMGHGL